MLRVNIYRKRVNFGWNVYVVKVSYIMKGLPVLPVEFFR